MDWWALVCITTSTIILRSSKLRTIFATAIFYNFLEVRAFDGLTFSGSFVRQVVRRAFLAFAIFEIIFLFGSTLIFGTGFSISLCSFVKGAVLTAAALDNFLGWCTIVLLTSFPIGLWFCEWVALLTLVGIRVKDFNKLTLDWDAILSICRHLGLGQAFFTATGIQKPFIASTTVFPTNLVVFHWFCVRFTRLTASIWKQNFIFFTLVTLAFFSILTGSGVRFTILACSVNQNLLPIWTGITRTRTWRLRSCIGRATRASTVF